MEKNYSERELNESEVHCNPFNQFEKWFNEAINFNIIEANAMALSTCSVNCKPSVRTVLLKHFDENGFVFYTNYESRKGKELKNNPNAALLLFWKELERQIRIEGFVEITSRKESKEYFNARPFESQIASAISDQSTVIKNREVLEEKFNEYRKKLDGSIVPLPDYWGGFRLIPDTLEFWQGRKNRMHDRILYTKENNIWRIERLSP